MTLRRTEAHASNANETEALHIAAVDKAFARLGVLFDVHLQVSRGERVALLGPSGCGKTTLLRIIAGLEHADAGVVRIDGRIVAGPDVWVPPEQRGVGLVFQDYALFPHLNAATNVGFGLSKPAPTRVAELLALVGLSDKAEQFPHELSGGQQQRLALARALAPSPSLLLLDEPFSNLDVKLRHALRTQVADVVTALQTTTVLVTHDQQEAFLFADRVAVVLKGRVCQFAPPRELYTQPASLEVARFVGEANVLSGDADGQRCETALGTLTGRGDSGRVQVVVRPEQLRIVDGASPNATLARVQFAGTQSRLLVRVDGIEQQLAMTQPATASATSGARVCIEVSDTVSWFPHP